MRQIEQLEFQLEELEAVRDEAQVAEPLANTEAVPSAPCSAEPSRRSLPEHLPQDRDASAG